MAEYVEIKKEGT